MRKTDRSVNWTIVAISAGVTLGAGVALLGSGGTVPGASGLVVPQSVPMDDSGATARPPRADIPTVVEIVPVSAVGYTPPVAPPPPPPRTVAVKPKPAVPSKPSPTPRVVTQRAQQVIDGSSWSDWFNAASSSSYYGSGYSYDSRSYGGDSYSGSSYSGSSYGGSSYGGSSYSGGRHSSGRQGGGGGGRHCR